MTDHMKRSWLVQRLQKPRTGHGPLANLANAFAFGGGLKNGGLSDEAMGLLREVFSFDYMGAAEFEFGAVPEALQRIAKKPKALVADSFTIALADVRPSWQERRAKATEPPSGEASVYILCRRDHRDEVEARVRGWAADGYEAELKESTQLDSTLRPFNDYDGHTVGWLELDNGFFAFTDEAMWRQTCDLFGATVPAEVSR